MIVSFNVEEVDDLELLLALTKRLGIERVRNEDKLLLQMKATKNILSHRNDDSDEINSEIDSIFGVENSNVSF